jgi:hypothetical protein
MPAPSSHFLGLAHLPIMSTSHRLFRFPTPAWLNSANTRTAGVYLAGALVRLHPTLAPPWTLMLRI